MVDISQILRGSRELAVRSNFPPFVGPERESTPLNATPYMAHISDVQEDGFLSNRAAFLAELSVGLDQLQSIGAKPIAVLIGGSAIGPKPDPSDLDCVVFYEVIEGESPSKHLSKFQKQLKSRRIDARLIPIDGDPLLLIKAVSFFTTLYSKNSGSLEIVRGLVLLDCRPQRTF